MLPGNLHILGLDCGGITVLEVDCQDVCKRIENKKGKYEYANPDRL